MTLIEFINWLTVPIFGFLIGIILILGMCLLLLLLYISNNFKDKD